MKDRIRENGIDYVLVGDYYIPDLDLPEEERRIGKYGCMHREYLKENNPMLYNDLILSCQLWTYLADVNEQAQRTGFHLSGKSGSFYDLIIETSENGKNILRNAETRWIYCR